MCRLILCGLLFSGALMALSGSRGQTPKGSGAAASAPPRPAGPRELAKFTLQQRHFYLSGQRGMEWLQRANRPDGRFVPGFLPALRLPMEGDSYVRQAGAAFALTRAAKYYADDRSLAIARQAILTLLLDTSALPKEADEDAPTLRNVPFHESNPLAAAGMLLAAIHELPAPAADLVLQADQLANLLRKRALPDGSLGVSQSGDGTGNFNADASREYFVRHSSGPALYGIICSQHLRPAAWKLEALRKARSHYYSHWKRNKNAAMPAWHSAAYTEAYLLTKDQDFAEVVFEMNDWLCSLQHKQALPGRAAWVGAFEPSPDSKALALAPDIGSAGAALSLAEACRLARACGDVQRFQRYRQALESGLQFLTTLQYSEANTQHFADWYRPTLVGAFHASIQDGNVRLDYVQDALSALVQYLLYVADVP